MKSKAELIEMAKDIVIDAGKCSASLIQRRLNIGYATASEIIEALEEQGIVGASDGAKPREVLIKQNKMFSEEPEDKSYLEVMAEEEEEEIPGYRFSLKKIVMKPDMTWHVTFDIREPFNKIYVWYEVHIELNEKIWLDRIAELRASLEGTLFKKEKISEEELAERIREQSRRLEQARELSEKIFFFGRVITSKPGLGNTEMVLVVPDDAMEKINRQKLEFTSSYIIKLKAGRDIHN